MVNRRQGLALRLGGCTNGTNAGNITTFKIAWDDADTMTVQDLRACVALFPTVATIDLEVATRRGMMKLLSDILDQATLRNMLRVLSIITVALQPKDIAKIRELCASWTHLESLKVVAPYYDWGGNNNLGNLLQVAQASSRWFTRFDLTGVMLHYGGWSHSAFGVPDDYNDQLMAALPGATLQPMTRLWVQEDPRVRPGQHSAEGIVKTDAIGGLGNILADPMVVLMGMRWVLAYEDSDMRRDTRLGNRILTCLYIPYYDLDDPTYKATNWYRDFPDFWATVLGVGKAAPDYLENMQELGMVSFVPEKGQLRRQLHCLARLTGLTRLGLHMNDPFFKCDTFDSVQMPYWVKELFANLKKLAALKIEGCDLKHYYPPCKVIGGQKRLVEVKEHGTTDPDWWLPDALHSVMSLTELDLNCGRFREQRRVNALLLALCVLKKLSKLLLPLDPVLMDLTIYLADKLITSKAPFTNMTHLRMCVGLSPPTTGPTGASPSKTRGEHLFNCFKKLQVLDVAVTHDSFKDFANSLSCFALLRELSLRQISLDFRGENPVTDDAGDVFYDVPTDAEDLETTLG